jgi:eukaryotic-like serine/threonine-protein kinase
MRINKFGKRYFLLVALCALSEAPTAAPLTEKDTVVLGDFDNKTGETVFDGALKQALALELGQSPFLNVLSDRKVSETLRTMGRPATGHVTPDVGRELCLRAGSKAAIVGTISNPRGHYLLELTAVACGSGEALVKEQTAAASKEEILKALSQASLNLRAKLGESVQSVQNFDVPIQATTFSMEALKEYSIGIAVRSEKGDTPTIPYLKRAIELDPDFPLPHAELAAIYRNFRQPSAALEYGSRAYQLRDRVGEREKLKITGIYYLATGDLDKEIQNYEAWQIKYPRDFQPYNNLGNDYAFTGQLDKSLAEYEQALLLMPSLISYTNVVGLELNLNRLDAAGASLDEAFANKLDGRYLRQNLYWLAFMRGNVAQMQQQVAWASGKPGDEDVLLSMQSDTEAYYGRVVKAQDFTRRAVNSAVRAGSKETAALWQANSALRMAEVGLISVAREEANSALRLSSGRDVKLIAAFTFARAGENHRAKALVQELKKTYPTDFLMKLYWLPTINAAIELNGGNVSQALKELETAAPYELGVGSFVDYLYPAYVRGQVYLLAHQADAAAAEFQKLLDHPGIVSNFMTGALAHLQLGRAYAVAGDNVKAKAAYQDFFTLWKYADEEIPALKRAKSEYTTLQQQRRVPGRSLSDSSDRLRRAIAGNMKARVSPMHPAAYKSPGPKQQVECVAEWQREQATGEIRIWASHSKMKNGPADCGDAKQDHGRRRGARQCASDAGHRDAEGNEGKRISDRTHSANGAKPAQLMT